jgi:uncharacterized protein (DUF1330 family)
MPTNIVGDIHISDPASYQAHSPRALATIARFGGRQCRNGSFSSNFPPPEAARRWYQSDDYQEALKTRLSASHGRVLLIEGNEISSAVPVAWFGRREN